MSSEAKESNNKIVNEAVCIVSPNKKGFWQADVYLEGWEEGAIVDYWCSGKIGGTKEQIIEKVKQKYPDINCVDGITGYCEDCGEEFTELEEDCQCGGIVNQY